MKVLIIATLDTKSKEALYIKKTIERSGLDTILMDAGISKSFAIADIDAKELLQIKGYDLEKAILAEKRSELIYTIAETCGEVIEDLCKKNQISGILGIGGNQGTAICGIAMQKAPFFLPKIIVSTVASGNMRPYIRHKDIFVVFSITDLCDRPNFINKHVLDNAIGSLIAMSRRKRVIKKPRKPVIGLTAFGNTSKAVNNCSKLLRELNYAPVVFHASGAGGSAMEELIENDLIDGVLDLTSHEIIGEVFDFDIYKPTKPMRLQAAAQKGIPQVIATGGLDYFVFGAPDTIPVYLKDRKMHYHNPYNTNVRILGEELEKVADLLTERLNNAKGPVSLLIPLEGWSEIGARGNLLFDKNANDRFIERIKRNFASSNKRGIKMVPYNINDNAFSELCVKELHSLFELERRTYQGLEEFKWGS